jgi:hypothetical protein
MLRLDERGLHPLVEGSEPALLCSQAGELMVHEEH